MTSAPWSEIETLYDVAVPLHLSYDAVTHDLVVTYFPGRVYGQAGRELLSYVGNEFSPSRYDFVESGGAATNYLSPSRAKQGDEALFSIHRSDDAKLLKSDAAWWLEGGEVNLIILIILKTEGPKSLDMELWEHGPQLPPQNSAPGRQYTAVQRGHRQSYPPSAYALVEPLRIRYADLEIPGMEGELVVPLSKWSARLWRLL
ncbi:hypothetical protein FB451DRAFT_1557846 [Mycena latifolia]|nr:hypothetical protein FB451DRAFT_1557846 [Mycena latifolia]